jgi:hypothetical protein
LSVVACIGVCNQRFVEHRTCSGKVVLFFFPVIVSGFQTYEFVSSGQYSGKRIPKLRHTVFGFMLLLSFLSKYSCFHSDWKFQQSQGCSATQGLLIACSFRTRHTQCAGDAEVVNFDSLIMIMVMRSRGRNLSSICLSTAPFGHSHILIGLVCSALLFFLFSFMVPLCYDFWMSYQISRPLLCVSMFALFDNFGGSLVCDRKGAIRSRPSSSNVTQRLS